VSREKNQAGDGQEIVEKTVELMREIAKLYPAKREASVAPWQVSLSHAVFVSAWDTQFARSEEVRDPRRMIIVPAPGGTVDAGLAGILDAADVLGRFESHYVFVKLDPATAPAEWAEALKQAGPQGLMIADTAKSVDGFGKHAGPARIYPAVVAAKAGPLDKAGVIGLLGKHVAR
jgi:hypothetical protein